MSAIFFAVCQIFPEAILKIYMDVDDTVLAIGPRIVRLYSTSLLVVGFSLVCNYYFQSTLLKSACVLVSMLRGLIFPVVFVFTLPLIFGYDFIWLAVPVGEALTAVVAIILFIIGFKSQKRASTLTNLAE